MFLKLGLIIAVFSWKGPRANGAGAENRTDHLTCRVRVVRKTGPDLYMRKERKMMSFVYDESERNNKPYRDLYIRESQTALDLYIRRE